MTNEVEKSCQGKQAARQWDSGQLEHQSTSATTAAWSTQSEEENKGENGEEGQPSHSTCQQSNTGHTVKPTHWSSSPWATSSSLANTSSVPASPAPVTNNTHEDDKTSYLKALEKVLQPRRKASSNQPCKRARQARLKAKTEERKRGGIR